jgi:hypothetical protein
VARVGNADPTISTLRTLLIVIALGAALASTSCGGSDQSSAEAPRLPRALASDLADTSEAIADALDAGDVCGAADLADQLKDAVDAAVSAEEVPPELRGELEQTALELQNGVNCEAPPEEEQDEGEENGENGQGKKKGHDKEGTDTLGTTTIGTTTEEE